MSKTNRRGFLKFLGVGAAGAGVVAAAGPAQARPAPAEVPLPANPRPPACTGNCGHLVLDQASGHFEERLCEECRTGVVPSPYSKGTTGWAREQIVAGHRVRQRCWKDGAGCELPQGMVEQFGHRYDKGIDSFTGLPAFTDMLFGGDWEIVP